MAVALFLQVDMAIMTSNTANQAHCVSPGVCAAKQWPLMDAMEGTRRQDRISAKLLQSAKEPTHH